MSPATRNNFQLARMWSLFYFAALAMLAMAVIALPYPDDTPSVSAAVKGRITPLTREIFANSMNLNPSLDSPGELMKAMIKLEAFFQAAEAWKGTPPPQRPKLDLPYDLSVANHYWQCQNRYRSYYSELYWLLVQKPSVVVDSSNDSPDRQKRGDTTHGRAPPFSDKNPKLFSGIPEDKNQHERLVRTVDWIPILKTFVFPNRAEDSQNLKYLKLTAMCDLFAITQSGVDPLSVYANLTQWIKEALPTVNWFDGEHMCQGHPLSFWEIQEKPSAPPVEKKDSTSQNPAKDSTSQNPAKGSHDTTIKEDEQQPSLQGTPKSKAKGILATLANLPPIRWLLEFIKSLWQK